MLYYLYDDNGAVMGIGYGDNTYTFAKNIQGDVIGIYSGGTLVAKYQYNAYGVITAITDANGNDVSGNATHIANLNPFRYRGYYYDTETGFYYLQTRYYDPVVGRFLNADAIIGANGGIIGYNLFAYCNNNPISFTDPSGYCYYKNEYAPGYYNFEDVGCWAIPEFINGEFDYNRYFLCNGCQNLIDLLKAMEDFTPKLGDALEGNAYAIGYGYTFGYTDKRPLLYRVTGSYFPSTITEKQAEYLLFLTLVEETKPKLAQGAEEAFFPLGSVSLDQYNALLSLSYNSTRRYKSVMGYLALGCDPQATFLSSAIGEQYPGIKNRRYREYLIYAYGVYTLTVYNGDFFNNR